LEALSAHVRSHVAPPEQLTEQDPVHVTWQVALPSHVTLPLAPTVRSHVAPPVQSALHESPQVPVQSLCEVQLSEQLGCVPQALCEMSQAPPDVQLQLEPLHVGGGVPPLLHRAMARRKRSAKVRWKAFIWQ
jgi:hypothetical protein